MSFYLTIYERLKDHLHTSFIGKRVISYKCVKSTQDVAISLAEREKENVHGLVVVAESQKKEEVDTVKSGFLLMEEYGYQ